MKKGRFIFLALVLLICLGAFVRYTVISKEIAIDKAKIKDENASNDLEALKIKNIYGKPLVENVVMDSSIKLSSILVGRWDYIKKETFQNKNYGFAGGELDFESSHSFRLNVNVMGLSENDTTRANAWLAAGGGMMGTWECVNDCIVNLTASDCQFQIGYKADPSNNFDGCLYFGYPLGTVKKAGWETEIKAYNQDTILIIGTDYRGSGSKLYVYLTRIK